MVQRQYCTSAVGRHDPNLLGVPDQVQKADLSLLAIMDQTLRQICSLVAFQIKTVVVSILLSLRLGFHILRSSLVDLFWGKQPEQAERVKETGAEAQDWVVVGNAESVDVQANGGKRKKVRPADPVPHHSSTPFIIFLICICCLSSYLYLGVG
jgi:hypothetical protein